MTEEELERALAYKEEVQEELERRKQVLHDTRGRVEQKEHMVLEARRPAVLSGKRGGFLKTRVAHIRSLERELEALKKSEASIQKEVFAAKERLQLIDEEIAELQQELEEASDD